MGLGVGLISYTVDMMSYLCKQVSMQINSAYMLPQVLLGNVCVSMFVFVNNICCFSMLLLFAMG